LLTIPFSAGLWEPSSSVYSRLQTWLRAVAQRLRREPLFLAALAAVLGIFLARLNPGFPVWCWFAGCLAALAAALRGLHLAPLLLLSVALGFSGIHALRDSRTGMAELLWAGQRLDSPLQVAVHGVATDPPRETRTGELLLAVELTNLDFRGLELVTRDRIRLRLPKGTPARQGDRFAAEGVLRLYSRPRNPGEISPQIWANRTDHTVAEMQVLTPLHYEVTGRSVLHRALESAQNQRDWVGRAITRGLDAEATPAQILQAMYLGAREAATPETEESFRLSGAMHIFAVSGLHVGIFASVIWVILATAGVSRRPAILAIIACVLFYAWITGLRPSAVRAAVMTTVFLAGFWLRREPRLLNSLGVAALVILLFDSRQLFAIGFQLSFVVLLAISVIAPPLRAWLSRPLQPDPFLPTALITRPHRFWIGAGQRVMDVISVSLAAWIGSLPLLLFYFGLVTPVALLANCILVPLTWPIICLATISLALSLLQLGFFAALLNQLNAGLVQLLHHGAIFFASFPGGHLEVTPMATPSLPTSREPSLTVFDMNRSCGPQLLEFPATGDQWLIDCGTSFGYASVIRPYLQQKGRPQLNGFFVTHPDSNHAAGATELIADLQPDSLYTTRLPARSVVHAEIRNLPATPSEFLARGDHLALPDGAHLEVLFPPPDYADQASADDECLVLHLTWQGWRILLMSDSGFKTEKWLLEHAADQLKADVMIKSQHGSDYSALGEFLLAVKPQVIVTTHDTFPPNEAIRDSWRDFLELQDIELFDQQETGAVTIRLRPEAISLHGFVNQQKLEISSRTED